MSEDFTIYQLQDEKSNKVIYGFSLEEIRNDPNYVFIDKFSNGLARVKRNNKYGFYNNKGEVVIPFKYDYAEPFNGEYILANNYSKWFLMDNDENKLFEFNSLIKENKELIKKRVENITWMGSFIKDLLIMKVDKGGKWGNGSYYIINKIGQVVNGPFHKINKMNQFGLSKVESYSSEGIINKNGKFVVKLKKYSEIEDFNEYGIAKVEIKEWLRNDKHRVYYGFINKEGKEILKCSYKRIRKTDEYELMKIENKNGKWGVISTKGKLMTKIEYDTIFKFDQYGLAKVKKSNRYGVINIRGETIVPIKYAEIWYFDKFGLAKFNASKYNGVLKHSRKRNNSCQ